MRTKPYCFTFWNYNMGRKTYLQILFSFQNTCQMYKWSLLQKPTFITPWWFMWRQLSSGKSQVAAHWGSRLLYSLLVLRILPHHIQIVFPHGTISPLLLYLASGMMLLRGTTKRDASSMSRPDYKRSQIRCSLCHRKNTQLPFFTAIKPSDIMNLLNPWEKRTYAK